MTDGGATPGRTGTQASPPAVPGGRRILADRYEIGPVLGRGGMARVHLGLDRTLKRRVAVKILAEPWDQDRDFAERFRREALAAARLNHPNIVQVFDAGSDGGTPFIVMELVDGPTLTDRMRDEGAISPPEAVRIGGGVARALGAAHERGVIHRDVKPSNVMLTPTGLVKVVDFGIARTADAPSVTGSGVVLGTVSYLSPEQAVGASGDERSDVYALGCLLHEMLTGRPPFVAADPVAVLYQHVNQPARPPSTIRPIPPGIERAILRCIEKDPDHRFGSALELEDALLAASTGEPGTPMPGLVVRSTPTEQIRGDAPPTPPIGAPAETVGRDRSVAGPGRPRTRWWLVAALAASMAAAVVGAIALLEDPVPPQSDAVPPDARASTSPQSTLPTEQPGVARAAEQLSSAIVSASSAGQILGDGFARELLDDTEDVTQTYGTGDVEALRTELDDLAAGIETGIGRGIVAPDAAPAIEASFDALVDSVGIEPSEVIGQVTPSPTENGDENAQDEDNSGPGDGDGDGDGDGGHGPG